jgi:uncharacterized protein YuzE
MSDATVTSILPYIEAAREARERGEPARLKLTYDPEARAAYLYLTSRETIRAEHGRTVWAEECEVILDLDAEGRILGIEILGADVLLRPETIALAEARS